MRHQPQSLDFIVYASPPPSQEKKEVNVATNILEKQAPVITYPEIPSVPANFIGFCPLKRNTPTGWPPGMPKRVRQAIIDAVPAFGMGIRVFYPPIPLWLPVWGRKCDPLVIGEKHGKYYLIAAWE